VSKDDVLDGEDTRSVRGDGGALDGLKNAMLMFMLGLMEWR
jgi:hypothetical protein